MKVIMLQDLKKVGKKGDIVEVAEGYGRNFLIAKKYAVEATKQKLTRLIWTQTNQNIMYLKCSLTHLVIYIWDMFAITPSVMLLLVIKL